jgi:hypothetical protein
VRGGGQCSVIAAFSSAIALGIGGNDGAFPSTGQIK